MADNKNAREKQAADAERRQRKREVQEALSRGDEDEPPAEEPGRKLGDLDGALDEVDYPTTSEEIVRTYGDREIQSQDGLQSVDEVLAPVDDETYESADEVRSRLLAQLRR